MIDPEVLKKHNLKAVPFACIGEGEGFFALSSLRCCYNDSFKMLERRFEGDDIFFVASGNRAMCDDKGSHLGCTVYVPVWRPCREVAK